MNEIRKPVAGAMATANPKARLGPERGLAFGYDPWFLNDLRDICHDLNVKAGWWTNPVTGLPKERNVGELLCLVHSEVSEAMEGHRKGLMDDKLPHRPMIEVELVDVLIRVFDLAGALQLDLGGAFIEKIQFNQIRLDHKAEARLAPGGKAY